MFHAIIQHIEPLIEAYGALGVFIASVIEEMIAPIPSSIVVFTASAILAHGLHGQEAAFILFTKVVLPASAGMTLGSLLPYCVARIGEKVAIDRFGKYIGVDWTMIEKLKQWSAKTCSDELIIFGTRAIPGLPTMAVSILAGLAQIRVFEFVVYSFLGSLVRTSLLGFVGWYGGKQYSFILGILSNAEDRIFVIAFAVLLSTLAAWIVLRRQKKVELEGRIAVPEEK